jgi:hypothetical protein
MVTGATPPSFDIKEIEAIGGMMEDLESFTLQGCILTDDMLKSLFSCFKSLKTLVLKDCHGYTNHSFLMMCFLLPNIKELIIEGGPMDYNRSITHQGLAVFKEYNVRLEV